MVPKLAPKARPFGDRSSLLPSKNDSSHDAVAVVFGRVHIPFVINQLAKLRVNY